MTTSLASYRRGKTKSKSNSDICSIANDIGCPANGGADNVGNLRRSSSDDLSDLAEIMDDAIDQDDDLEAATKETNVGGVRKEQNNRRNVVR